MKYSANFAGIELGEYCNILNIKRSLLPQRSNFSKEIPIKNGSYYTGYKYKERKITLEVAIIASSREEYIKKINELASVLDVPNPSKLVLSDDPDRYCYAVLDGSTDLTKSFFTGKVEINFICHDPAIYSDAWKCFAADTKGIVTFENGGTLETLPVFDVIFRNKACFFQITNPLGQTVLIGEPKNITKPTTPLSDLLVNDDCTDSSKYLSISQSLLDSNRTISGNYGVGINGEAMVCTNYGTEAENGWSGSAFKKNISQNVDEFEVSIDLVFSSHGKNYQPPVPVTPPPTHDNPKPSPTLGTYEVVNCGGLWMNKEPNTKHPLYPLAPKTYIYPTEIKGRWAKHTHSNKWHTFTGWSYMRYLRKVSSGIVRSKAHNLGATSGGYAEDQIGLLEIYGYDQNGKKLFKVQVSDTNEFYEYVEPQVYVGNNLILDDGKNCPNPRKITQKDEDGKKKTISTESGVFGDFNDLEGKVVIRREKNSKNEYIWTASIYKYKNGAIVKSIQTINGLSNASFPKESLNYLGFYIGKYPNHPAVDAVGITNVKVKCLNMNKLIDLDNNLEIFEPDDHLQIDFEKGVATLNDQVIDDQIDIGSEFFSIPKGNSQVITRSDDTTALVACGIQEKYI